METILRNKIKQYSSAYAVTQKKYHQITIIRLLVFFTMGACVYFTFKNTHYYLLIPAFIGLLIFFILVKVDTKIITTKKRLSILKSINEKELDFLHTNKSNYASGIEFQNKDHLYTNDIDIFGNNSLFQYLNRTATQMGYHQLAIALQQKISIEEIEKIQEAVKETSAMIDFRQEVQALATMANDSKEKYEKIKEWSRVSFKPIPPIVNVLLFVLPILLVTVIVLYNTTAIPNLNWMAIFLFIINVNITGYYGKQLLKMLGQTEKVNESINQYAKIIQLIENTSFQSAKMNELKSTLLNEHYTVSKQLQQLATIIGNIETIQNVFGATVVNGFTFFHLHQFNALNRWKEKYDTSLEQWLSVIGEVEKINSFANLWANQPTFCFPSITKEGDVFFENIGHPLIHSTKRVCNTVSIHNQQVILLSGSNMSGKSTFLRTLGINMVLGNAGAPVCATKATIVNQSIVCCMRLSDSLEENESYFFAEVKRLQQIMAQCQFEKCFVLLDEVLRGTNSDDKKQGTIQIVQKLMKLNAMGIVATHDIEVCHWGETQTKQIQLFCFENDIVNNDLYFDYLLRNGICKNKTASFLLHKMKVVS